MQEIVEKPSSTDFHLMGVNVGTYTGWDLQSAFAIVIYDFIPNEAGLKFVPDFVGPDDLGVNWENGQASIYDEIGNETHLKSDWSVFNKEGGPGWQVKDNEDDDDEIIAEL